MATTITPEIEHLNQFLRDCYGIETTSDRPMWRVVFSDDQYEKRLTKYTDSGIELLVPEVRELPKYKQWIHGKWILENLVVVPEMNKAELAEAKTSYECLFVFENDKGDALPPRIDVCQLIINIVGTAKGERFNAAKYKEDPEAKAKELAEMEQYLHGNETDVTDALMFGTGVSVPSNYDKDTIH